MGPGLGKVRCFEFGPAHTSFTLFSPDEKTSVYVQMYKLPEGQEKFNEDLAFQASGTSWGKKGKGSELKLKIFPADWTHEAYLVNPKRCVHKYQGPDRAVFIRYIGSSMAELMF